MHSYFDWPNHESDDQRGCGINRRNPGRMHIFEKYTFETSIVYTSLGYLELYFEEFGISPEQTFFHPDDGVFSSGTALFIRTIKIFHPEYHFFIRNGPFHPDEKIFSSGTAFFIRTMALFHPERHFFIRTTALFLRTKPATASGTPHTTSIPSSMHG